MKKEVYLFLFIFSLSFFASHLLIFNVVAQEKKKEDKGVNNYIYKFKNKLNVDLFTDTFRFKIDLNQNGKEITIRPNTPFRTNIAVSYKFLRLQFGITPLFSKLDAIKNGTTRDINIELDFFVKRFRQIISFDAIRGMYLANTDDIVADYVIGEPNKQFPDMSQVIIEGQTSYNFNPNFSHRALDLENEWQKRSAISFSPYIIYHFKRIRDFPSKANGHSYLPFTLPQEVDNYVFNIQPRFYSILVYKEHWFLMTMLYPSIGYKYNVIKSFDENSINYVHIPFWGGGSRIQLGYNSTHFYAGTFFTTHQTRFSVNSVFIAEVSLYFSVYLGYRFTVPNFIKNTFNKAEMMFNLKHSND